MKLYSGALSLFTSRAASSCGAFSVADIATFIMVNAAATLGATPGAAHASVRDWLARTRARPAVRREAEAIGAYAAKALAGSTAT